MQDDALLRTAGRIADGVDEPWPPAGGTPSTPRSVADELAIVARIAREYRRLNDSPDETTESGPVAEPARRWGQLELFDVVGRGAYGTVFRARDPQLDKEVALKVCHGKLDATRMIDEGRRLAKVRHPNVVTVFGADVVDGVAGIWMELIHGRSLAEVVDANGPLSAREAVVIGLEVAGALAAVHHAGLVHRDVKAQNVMREDGGRIVLMDLSASMSATDLLGADPKQIVVGTPAYMAPELFEMKTATRQSDIYSLGVLLFYLVSGQFPVQVRTLKELKAAHRARAGRSLRDVRPDLPQEFVALVSRMIAPDPAARYATAGELERDLAALAARTRSRASRTSLWRWGLSAAAVLSLVALGFSGVWRRAIPSLSAAPRTVAVLPIRNLTGDASVDYVAEALTDVLIADLACIHAIRVPSYAAVASFRDPSLASSVVADRLHAGLLLTGAIAGDGDRLRMTVALVDPASGRTEWAQTFTRPRAEALATEAEVARLVAAHLSLRLGPNQELTLNQRAANPEAQDAYFRGLVAANGAGDDRQPIAAEFFRKAVTLDPQFASGWAQLALVELRVADNSSFDTRNRLVGHIRESALHAIELNSASAEGYAALGALQFYFDWDFPAAERSFKQALDLNPSYAFARQRYAMFLASQSRLAEALDQAKTGRDQEPLMSQRVVSYAFIYYYLRDYNRAEQEMEGALAIDANYAVAHFGLGRIASAMGDQERAIREINKALDVSRNSAWLFELARVYTVAGRSADATRTLDEIESRRASDQVGSAADSQAYIAAAAGRLDDAFRILDDAVSNRVENLLWIRVDPRADPLRGDPRYAPLLRRMGL